MWIWRDRAKAIDGIKGESVSSLPLEIDEKQAKRIDSLRYHAIGNAVTPPVAEWVGTRLAKVMADQDLEYIQSGNVQGERRLTA